MARIWHPNVPGMIIFRLFCRILGLSGWSYGREFGPWEVLWYFNSQWQFFGLIKKKNYQAFFCSGIKCFSWKFHVALSGVRNCSHFDAKFPTQR
jgi:hypothetical protein